MDVSGRRSRRGFRYQDLCALRYCIAAAVNDRWTEVHHDYEDDVVLVGTGDGGRRVRYVQVKHEDDAKRHWSCARLLAHAPKETVAASVLGRLFDRDEGTGERDFRLAVNEGVDHDLAPMHYRWGHVEPTVDMSSDGAKKLVAGLSGWTSPLGQQAQSYVQDFLIEQHSNDIDDMSARLHAELVRLLRRRGARSLLDNEVGEILDGLFLVVFRAGSDDERRPGHPESIRIAEFRELALEKARTAQERTDAAATTPQENLANTLTSAAYDREEIELALGLRRAYYQHWMRDRGTRAGDFLDAALEDVQRILAEGLIDYERTARDFASALSGIEDAIAKHHAAHDYDSLGVTAELMRGMLYFAISRSRLQP